jgi:hypothetical protein
MTKYPSERPLLLGKKTVSIFALKYRQDDGQVVIATMKRIGWERPPAEELKEIMAILNAGPQSTYNKPNRRLS